MKIRAFLTGSLLLSIACSGENAGEIGRPNPLSEAQATSAPEGEVADVPSDELTLNVAVDGTGVVRSEPAGIACPGKCSAMFAREAAVTLTVEAAEGWELDTFTGSCTGASCALTMGDDRTVKAKLSLLDPRWDPAVGSADCASAWGKGGEKLSPCDKTPDDYVVVHKSKRNTALCKSGKLVRNFRSGLGFAPAGSKEKEGDGKTPEGVFFVPRLIPDSTHHRAFLLSYPSRDDATRGFTAGLVSSYERSQIVSAHEACKEPPQYTSLGGLLEILGGGSEDDWTAGSVALGDADIDEMWKVIGIGDTVVVLP
jgi:hypothetical protein